MPSITEDDSSSTEAWLNIGARIFQGGLFKEWPLPGLEKLPVINQFTILYGPLTSPGIHALLNVTKRLLAAFLAG